ncbi:MAG TPA: hypothetical protein VGU61_10155 [Noviherbaspirillum sp.]|jgi:hypothetical protein|uniref:hypothetical protein n=1 Tax=Noviherbaspirillum sp. TaxID=1926288 RepID=UPI002DDD468C|nr:hypothetical protein [Noviherbaspirillum sp.]HEV2610617.1 hypothetical protein [Noviherbaspirillum sp.]
MNKLRQAIELERESLQDMKLASTLDFSGQPERAAEFHIAATSYNEAAEQALDCRAPPVVISGECTPTEMQRPDNQGGWAIRNTLASPDTAAIQASIERTDLLMQGQSEVLALGLDAAESANCDNSLEKMLAHQMALAHTTAFKVIDEAMRQRDAADLARLLNAGSRLMAVYQQGLLTLHRVKNGGNQTVTVQHVTVNGGQTVVTGSVQPQGPARPRGGVKE